MGIALATIATTAVGLMVGVELAVAVVVNPILARLPTEAGLAGRAHGARMLGKVMPFCYVGSLGLVLALAAVAWGASAGAAALAAACLLALSVVIDA